MLAVDPLLARSNGGMYVIMQKTVRTAAMIRWIYKVKSGEVQLSLSLGSEVFAGPSRKVKPNESGLHAQAPPLGCDTARKRNTPFTLFLMHPKTTCKK